MGPLRCSALDCCVELADGDCAGAIAVKAEVRAKAAQKRGILFMVGRRLKWTARWGREARD
jgi:hypothetical protein